MSIASQYFVLILILMYRFISSEMESKIVGGNFVNIINYPHAVFLDIQCSSPSTICGGTILNQDMVITAAHCLEACTRGDKVYVHAGHEVRGKGRAVRKSRKVLIHQNYNSYTVVNDIGMILLSKHLPLGAGIKRASIIPRTYRIPNNATVAGWGLTDEINGRSSEYLKAVTQPLVSRYKCMDIIHDLPKGALCAGSTKQRKKSNYPSSGDSGSGLLVDKVFLIGVVSYKDPIYPGLVVYTNVSYYLNWIRKSSKKIYCLK